MNNVRYRILGLVIVAFAFMFAGAVDTFAQDANISKARPVVTTT